MSRAVRFAAETLFEVDAFAEVAGSVSHGCTPRQRAALILLVVIEAGRQRVYVGDPGSTTRLERGPVVSTLRLNPQTAEALDRRGLVSLTPTTIASTVLGRGAVIGWAARGLV